MPVVNLAQIIDSGSSPSPEQVTVALAAVATLVTGNPIAGAAMAMAGGLAQGLQAGLQGVFSALGLYSNTQIYNYTGLRRTTDVIPSGQLDPDWWFIRTGGGPNEFHGDLYNIRLGVIPPGVNPHPGLSGNYNYTALNYFFTLLAYYDYAQKNGTPVGQIATSSSYLGVPAVDSGNGYFVAPLNNFEIFLLPMLRQTMENWANGIGFVQPRDVLQQAAIVWNGSHSSSSTSTYQPIDQGALNGSCLFVSNLLGGYGDLSLENVPTTRLSPLTINTGPSTTKVATSSSIGKHVAIAGGGALVGGLLYAWVSGKAVDKVFESAWEIAKDWVGRATGEVTGSLGAAEKRGRRR